MKKIKQEVWSYASTDKLPDHMSLEDIVQFGYKIWGSRFNVIASGIMARHIDAQRGKISRQSC